MKNKTILISIIGMLLCGWIGSVSFSPVLADDYVRATDDPDNVKNKIYPRKKKLEFGGDFGGILNQGFVNTFLIHLSANYFFSENWGAGLEYSIGMVSDKDERACIETFYNKLPDTEGNIPVDAECVSQDPDPQKARDAFSTNRVNYGPAYMPIREISGLAALNLIWNPVYGKQLVFMSSTSFFDIFFIGGVGVALSTFYPKSLELRNGETSRCVARDNEDNNGEYGYYNCGTTDEQYIGKEGRPDPESSTLPIINLGIGQKFHFGKKFSFKVELRNTTILGTPSAFENLVAVWGGLNIRI